MTNFNERTNTLLYKNTLLTLYSRKGCERVDAGYVWEVSWRRGQTATYWSKVLSSTSFASGLGCSTVGPWGLQALDLQADSHAGILSPTDSNCNWNWTRTDWLKPSVAPGYIIVSRPPASCGRTHLHRIQPRPQVKVIFRYLRPDVPVSLLFCLFTQVHLLIDGSVEGQYVTHWEKTIGLLF